MAKTPCGHAIRGEEGLRRGDAALNEMTPVGMGTRSTVEFYDVAVMDMR